MNAWLLYLYDYRMKGQGCFRPSEQSDFQQGESISVQQEAVSGRKDLGSIIIRQLIHPLVIQLTKIRIRHPIIIQSETSVTVSTPVIYAVNHTNCADIPITCRIIRRHAWVLIGKQRLPATDRLFFLLNGAIWVDRKDQQDRHRSKEKIQHHLQSGKSLIWFPEATWNLSDNLLMLPMRWGIIECAQKSQVPIIPIALDYSPDRLLCKARIGEPFNPDGMSLADGIRILRDGIAELRWALWEQKGIMQRNLLNPTSERKAIMKAVEDYPSLDLEYEQSTIFHLQNV